MGKKQKQSGSVPNRAIYSRLSYLYQAAAYIQSQGLQSQNPQSQSSPEAAEQAQPHSEDRSQPPTEQGQPELHKDIHAVTARRLLSDLRAASLKTQIRLDPSVKRTVCKYCDTLLIEGASCRSSVENRSRGGRKPWADVLVVKCGTCGGEKRFPVSAARQKRRPFRGEGVEGDVGGEGGEGLAEGKKGAPMKGEEAVPVRRKEEAAGE